MRRLTMITPMLAIAFAVPAFAQQSNVVEPLARQQAEAIVLQYLTAVNQGDAQAVAALYTPDAIDINPFGKFQAPSTQSQELTERVHKMGLTLSAKVDDVEPLFGGQGAIVTAPYTSTFTNPAIPPGRGNMLFVLEHIGDSWKIRAITASRSLPAAPPK